MSISFACGQCGKDFDVDAKFAGKHGRCKGCGAVMRIPMASHHAPGDFREAVAPEISPSRRAPAPARVAAPAEADRYAIDEAMPARVGFGPLDSDIGSPTVARPARGGKKSVGFFAAPKKRKKTLYDNGGPDIFRMIGKLVVGFVGGVAGVVALALVLPAVRRAVTPGLESVAGLESILRERVSLNNELTRMLSAVTDEASARSGSAAAIAQVKRITANLQRFQRTKLLKADQPALEALKGKYLPLQEQAGRGVIGQVARIALIPNAWEALALQPALEELGSVETSIPGMTQVQLPVAMPVPPPAPPAPIARPPGMAPAPPLNPGPRPKPARNRPRPGPFGPPRAADPPGPG